MRKGVLDQIDDRIRDYEEIYNECGTSLDDQTAKAITYGAINALKEARRIIEFRGDMNE